MTVENMQANGQDTGVENNQEVVALSVNDSAGKSGSVNLVLKSGLIYGNRPVEASHLKVISTFGAVGSNRPVTASTMDVKGTLTISGSRPIMASHLKVSDTFIMGNRPVASNEIDEDTAALMGYLD